MELTSYFIPVPPGVTGIKCTEKDIHNREHPLSAIPADLQPLFIEIGQMVEVPRGLVGGASCYPAGAVPTSLHLEHPFTYRRINPTRIMRDEEHLEWMQRLTAEFVREDAQRHAVIVRALHELDDLSKHILGFRALSAPGTPLDARKTIDFTITAPRNPTAHAGIVLRQCHGFCYNNKLWLIEPSNVQDIFKDALRMRHEAEDSEKAAAAKAATPKGKARARAGIDIRKKK